MSNNSKQPAFSGFKPHTHEDDSKDIQPVPGMTKQEFACIHLRVPKTGDADLDAIIREARRDEFAGLAMASLIECQGGLLPTQLTAEAIKRADTLLAALEGREIGR
jgi:hypothetical protein